MKRKGGKWRTNSPDARGRRNRLMLMVTSVKHIFLISALFFFSLAAADDLRNCRVRARDSRLFLLCASGWQLMNFGRASLLSFSLALLIHISLRLIVHLEQLSPRIRLGRADVFILPAASLLLAPAEQLKIFFCFWLAFPVALLLLFRRKKIRETNLPLAPFVLLAYFILYFLKKA